MESTVAGMGLILFRRHYPELDLVRATAITLVLMRHFSELHMRGAEGALVSLFDWGWHGVDLFFALSGFLIGGQIIEECRDKSFSFKTFFLKRTFRIVPPYLVAIGVFVAIISYLNGFFILRDGEFRNEVLSHALYMQDYVHYGKMYNGIYWSLAVEEKFYLILPLLIFSLYYVSKAGKGAHLLFSLAVLTAAGMAMRFLSYEPGVDFWATYLAPFHGRFDNLLLGVIAAFLYIHFRDRLRKVCKCSLLFVAAACLALSFAFGGFDTGYFNVCWQFTLTGIGSSALILALVSMDAGRFMPFKRVISALSKYSYTIYLYHLLILGLTQSWFKALVYSFGGGAWAGLIAFVVYFGGVTLLSVGIYTVVDRPFMSYRKRVLERAGKKAMAAASQ